jgi:Flp pilus assembly protein TadG
VEVAVCFPVFLLILIGIIEFGRAMSVNQLLNSGARIGCRAAILDGSTNTAVSNIVKQHVSSTVGCNESNVTVTITITSGTTGATVSTLSAAKTSDVIEIDVAVPFANVSWAVTRWLSSASVRGECSMQHE